MNYDKMYSTQVAPEALRSPWYMVLLARLFGSETHTSGTLKNGIVLSYKTYSFRGQEYWGGWG